MVIVPIDSIKANLTSNYISSNFPLAYDPKQIASASESKRSRNGRDPEMYVRKLLDKNNNVIGYNIESTFGGLTGFLK